MARTAELKSANGYVIALRHRTWAQWKNKVGSEKIRVWSSIKQRKIVFRKKLRVYNFWKSCFRARNDSTHKCLVCQTSCWIGLFSKFVKFHLVKCGNRLGITRKNNVVHGGKLSLIKDRKRARKSQPHACADVFQLCLARTIVRNSAGDTCVI